MARLRSKILFVTDGAFPPTSGTSIIIDNLLKELPSDKVFLAGELSYKSKLEEWEKPSYPIHFFRHKFNYGRGSKYSQWLVLPKVVKEIKEIIVKEKIDVVIGIFPNEFYVFAAYLAAKQTQKVAWRRVPSK